MHAATTNCVLNFASYSFDGRTLLATGSEMMCSVGSGTRATMRSMSSGLIECLSRRMRAESAHAWIRWQIG
jgi:hypothetical protein